MKNKRILTLILICIFTFSLSSVCFAYEFPHSFWAIEEAYNSAYTSGDDNGIITFGEKEYRLLINEPQNNDVYQVLASRTYNIAQAYERRGDYENSAWWYEKAIPSNIALGFDDAVKISKEKLRQFKPQISLYKKSYDTQVDFNAKNEHDAGVLCGIPFDSETRDSLSNESMTIVYHLYEDNFNGYSESFLKEASEKGIAVEVALNLKNEASDIGMINLNSQRISDFIDILAKYDNIPIYLRFAGEVNVWSKKPNKEDYKKAFRTVADIVRSKTSNIAMVYGVNFVSDWYSDFRDYYPGDEYVDWIGVSLYCNKHYLGVNAQTFNDKLNEIMFHANNSAEPVLMMDKIISEFPNKPFMVFESGATALTINMNEYSQGWATRRIEKIMNYLPMVYPQIKMIGHFDQYVNGENNDYSLKRHPALQECYNSQAIKTQFIQKTADNDSITTSVNCDNGFNVNQAVDTLSVYAQIYSSQYEKVNYFVDDTWVGSSDVIPYSCNIDFSAFTVGRHTLKYKVDSDTGKSYTKSVDFNITPNIKICVNGNYIDTQDQPPVIVNGRTLVPMRVLYEALGAEVEWNQNTKTAKATKNGDTIEMTIGNRKINKNGNLLCYAEVSPKIINDRTCIPARLAAELFSMKVSWDANTQTVFIN